MGVKARGGMEKKEEEKEDKFLLCESIGHRPLRGRCPKSKENISRKKLHVKKCACSHTCKDSTLTRTDDTLTHSHTRTDRHLWKRFLFFFSPTHPHEASLADISVYIYPRSPPTSSFVVSCLSVTCPAFSRVHATFKFICPSIRRSVGQTLPRGVNGKFAHHCNASIQIV